MATRKTTKKADEAVQDVKTVQAAAEKSAVETKTAAKKGTKSTTAKKASSVTATGTKKAPGRKPSVKANTEVYIQWWGKEVYAKTIVEDIQKVWTEEMGRKASELKDLKVYVKPEENAAHYVINGDITGCIGL